MATFQPFARNGNDMHMAGQQMQDRLEQFRARFACLEYEIGKVIVGQNGIVQSTLVALIAGGHVLLEGVPGLGKTLLVRTLAEVLRCRFSRIQFTPDLMPADLMGTNILLESSNGRRGFDFQRGPIFANVLLADEINRATPKTQSALLEAMQEHSVTVAGVTHRLEGLFFVLATQNPLEMEGTYPLPEAQLDRFFFKLLVRFPDTDDMVSIMARTTAAQQAQVQPQLCAEDILAMGALAREIPVVEEVCRYAVRLVAASHPDHPSAPEFTRRFVRYGASPRGAQAMLLAAKVLAILDQRYHVACEDLRAVAHDALRHRLILNFEGQAENVRPDDVIAGILDAVDEADK